MDPSLREIITSAVTDARKGGLDPFAQRSAATAVLTAMMPNLDMATVQLIVDQLYPLICDLGSAAA
ncbi:hypothetical protein CCC_03728 [Paramagnetospirillum magnetotacticum MS-1]|uniref:Uncharacterized protein n=1 Tax=Paramagnetospirillum magnetotacticum MS-1 TaxID=272627 RepID=A0A0C2YUR9_PARME|nr:hypothetical protein [Paramagnetospirillum magnetotacticum]KIL98445.1 hypothetical protein CCC_03728 [Paramagnetospirillum magnetotacticum MS-1]